MKVIQYNAITIDGFIATPSNDSEWVSDVDVEIFDAKIKEVGCIAMGNKTYEQFKGEYFPKKDAVNLVVTGRSVDMTTDGVVYVKSPPEAIKYAEEKGFKEMLLIGGGTLNGSFLKEELIDEIILDIHPLIFGKGIKLFEGFESFLKVELIESKNLARGQVLLRYKVLK